MSALAKFFSRNKPLPHAKNGISAEIQKEEKYIFPTTSPDTTCNLMVIGPEGCGKTAIIVRFLVKRFLPQYDGTTDRVYNRTLNIDGKLIQLNIIDKSGKGIMGKVTSLTNLSNISGLVVVFGINDSDSFNSCLDLLDYFKFDSDDTISTPTLVLGNKTDLSHSRAVSCKEAEMCVLKYPGCTYEECSAASQPDSLEVLLRSFIKRTMDRTDERELKTNGRKVSVGVLGSPKVIRSHFKRRFSMFGRDKNGST